MTGIVPGRSRSPMAWDDRVNVYSPRLAPAGVASRRGIGWRT